jgi:hypothetical protein
MSFYLNSFISSIFYHIIVYSKFFYFQMILYLINNELNFYYVLILILQINYGIINLSILMNCFCFKTENYHFFIQLNFNINHILDNITNYFNSHIQTIIL